MRILFLLFWASVSAVPGGPETEEHVRDLRSALPPVRAHAAAALGRTGDPAALPALCQALKDPAPSVRREAAKALGALKDAQAVPALVAALRDPDPNVRFYAAYALGEVRDLRAMDSLLQSLGDTAWNVREQAAWALRELNTPAVAAPAVVLLEAGVADAPHVIWLLQHLEARHAVEPLAKLLAHKDADVRVRAVEALAKLDDPKRVPALIEALGSQHAAVRLRAAAALHESRDERAVEPLQALAAREKDPKVLQAAEAAVTDLTREPGLAAHWSFDDGTARDVSGHGVDGQVIGCTPVEGKVGRAMRFGPKRYIELGNPSSLSIAGQPFTIMAWAKTDQPNGVVVVRGGAFCGYSLYVKEGLPKFGIHLVQDGPGYIAAGTEKATGRWVHLAGVVKEDRIELYVDGKLAAAAKTPGWFPGNCGQGMEIGFDVGNSPAEITDPFDGILDEVKAYGVALSAERIGEQAGLEKAP